MTATSIKSTGKHMLCDVSDFDLLEAAALDKQVAKSHLLSRGTTLERKFLTPENESKSCLFESISQYQEFPSSAYNMYYETGKEVLGAGTKSQNNVL